MQTKLLSEGLKRPFAVQNGFSIETSENSDLWKQ
jgi:hypothetical protein